MVHKSKKCSKKCLKHLFILKPVNHLAFISHESKYHFCCQDKNSHPLIPYFNNDRKSFTSAFILPSNQENSKNQDDNQRIEHFRLKVENHEQKSEMLLPKPSKKHSFCSICKNVFEDYQEHVLSFKHINLLRKSSINDEILHFCNMFGNNLKGFSENLQPQTQKQLPKIRDFSKQLKELKTHKRFNGFMKNINLSQQGWEKAIQRSFDVHKPQQKKQEKNDLNDKSLFRPTKKSNLRGICGNFKLCIPTATSLKESC